MTQEPDFISILEPGEKIVWQGRPVPYLYEERDAANRGKMRYLTWALFAGIPAFLILTMGPSLKGSPVGIALVIAFGVLFVLAGWYFTSGKPYFEASRRRKSWYALTDRRFLSATGKNGRFRFRKEKIDTTAPIRWDQQDPGDVLQYVRFQIDPTVQRKATKVQGFYKIPEAQKVHVLMLAIQKKLHDAAVAKHKAATTKKE